IIHQECGSRVVETWFKAITMHSWDEQTKTVHLEVPNSFVKSWIQKNYIPLMQLHLGRLLHIDMPRVVLRELVEKKGEHSSRELTTTNVSTKIVPARMVRHNGHDEGRRALVPHKRGYHGKSNHLFDTFVVGPSNALAYAAAHAVTERPGTL